MNSERSSRIGDSLQTTERRIAVVGAVRSPAALIAGALTLAAVTGWSGAGAVRADIAITHVTVIDVAKGAAVADQTVLIEGQRIARVGPAAELAVPDGAARVDGEGKFLIPGLFDAHVHYIDPESYGKLLIAHGVTFVRDMAGYTEHILALRDQLNRGDVLGPEMIATGAILDGDPPVWPFSEVCRTADEGRAAVKKLAEAGVDQIKVYSILKQEAYTAIVEEAHRLGLKAVGHVPEAVGLDEAIRVRQDSCEHLTGFGRAIAKLVDPATATQPADFATGMRAWAAYPKLDQQVWRGYLGRLRDSGMVQCPTLVVMRGVSRVGDSDAKSDPRLKYVSPSMMTFWQSGRYPEMAEGTKAILPHLSAVVGELHKAGVPLMCGTDLANPYVFAGSSLHDEMVLFREAGIPSADVVRSATLVPARFMGVADRHGSIDAGKTASLVLLRANPLDDVSAVRQIAGVFLKGKYFDRAKLDGLLQETAERVRGAVPAEASVKLELPGEVVLRGRYKATFNTMDAGDEEFLITRDAEGHHLMAHSRPKGFSVPSVTTLHVGADFSFRSAEWRQQSESPLTARYTLDGSKIRVSAARSGQPADEQTLDWPSDALVSAPAYAMEFVSNNAAVLEVGQTRAFNAVGFGYPDWHVTVTKFTLTRLDDTELKLGERSRPARRYTAVIETPMGNLNSETWTDERGVTLKSTLKMPFGVVAYELDVSEEPERVGGQ